MSTDISHGQVTELARLSEPEKDALIAALWAEVQRLKAHCGTRSQIARAPQGRPQFECASLADPEGKPLFRPTDEAASRGQCGPRGWGQTPASGPRPSRHRPGQNVSALWGRRAGPRATPACVMTSSSCYWSNPSSLGWNSTGDGVPRWTDRCGPSPGGAGARHPLWGLDRKGWRRTCGIRMPSVTSASRRSWRRSTACPSAKGPGESLPAGEKPSGRSGSGDPDAPAQQPADRE